MEQLKEQFYNRKEIATITAIDLHDHNFSKKCRNILSNWGYSFEYSQKGVKITRIPSTKEELLIELVQRVFDLDCRISARTFGVFFSLLSTYPPFKTMPWIERTKIINDSYNLEVSDRTLKTWAAKLVSKGIINKGVSGQWWKTTKQSNGENKREAVNTPELEEERLLFLETQSKLIQKNEEEWLKLKDPNAPKFLFRGVHERLWSEYQCCYYLSKTWNINAIDDNFNKIYDLCDLISIDAEENYNEELVTVMDVSLISKPRAQEFIF